MQSHFTIPYADGSYATLTLLPEITADLVFKSYNANGENIAKQRMLAAVAFATVPEGQGLEFRDWLNQVARSDLPAESLAACVKAWAERRLDDAGDWGQILRDQARLAVSADMVVAELWTRLEALELDADLGNVPGRDA